MTRLTHSFSSIKLYENCPLRYYHQRVIKSVVDKGGEASQYGERIHKFLELRLAENQDLPQEAAHYEKLVQSVETIAAKGELHIEREMTLNQDLKPTGWWDQDAWLRSKLDVLVTRGATAYVMDWKGLALDTRIPTPFGWTTMGDIAVGNKVFDANGKPCTVVGKSSVKNIRCFKVTFDDTTSVVCDEEHLWKLADGSVVNVQELMGKRDQRQRVRPPRIAVTKALELAETPLPVDPYVFGVWLADGKHSSGEISKPDNFIWEKIQKLGYEVNMETGGNKACPTRTVKNLRTQLRLAGLLTKKAIPQEYLRAGYDQRVALLQGLMDGDGNANPTRKQAVFTTVDKDLSDAVCELLCTLGQRPLQSKVISHGFGKESVVYPVSFRPIGINPFSLPRKAEQIKAEWGPGFSATRVAVSVEEIETVPTQCIAVDSEDHTFLCTERMVPTHNTGKRRPDFSQLELFALQVFAHCPEVDEVSSTFIWLKDMAMDKETYTRKQSAAMWQGMLARIRRIEQSLEKENWPAKPSGLCKFCPCRHLCEYAL